MRNEDKYSIFIGLSFLAICIVIVILAFKSAIMINKNADNVIYIDNGTGTMLTIPKSNLVKEHINIEKDIAGEKGILSIKVKLPMINIETENAKNLNNSMYAIYQELYKYALEIDENESVKVGYTYDYDDKTGILKIIISEQKNNSVKGFEYKYDVLNDKIIANN